MSMQRTSLAHPSSCTCTVKGAHAVHGTEMYGIVGQQRPGQSAEHAIRDTYVRDALLDFASGHHDRLWNTVTTEPISHGTGETGHPLDEQPLGNHNGCIWHP
jgi:carboxylesterase type B